ncbi:DUF2817 domain-containing protein (plasmid) [Microvirga sp. RSM25]|uniref:DUF2817 domain-containing protein n=1 Tax=Microvirga sp. RSM25 TaxID=3273802 RepID=UPI00384BD723
MIGPYGMFDVAMNDLFSRNYCQARERFLTLTSATAYPSIHVGPNGEKLITDVAYLGSVDAKNLLVLVSGTHGVEGYCGSAAQLSLLHSGLAVLMHERAGEGWRM